jgi:hypothetical protein
MQTQKVNQKDVLSGQHNDQYTPLNGSAHDKDELRNQIRLHWGEMKHPTVDDLVMMVLTSADLYGITLFYGKKT